MVVAQGGDPGAFEDRSRLPVAPLRTDIVAELEGYLERVDALTVARAAIVLGAGREKKGDAIDLAVGIERHARVGDRVARGQPLATIHASSATHVPEAERLLRAAIAISEAPVPAVPLILERLG